MVFVVHGNPVSTCTRRVLVAIAEAGVWDNFEMNAVDWAEIKTPEWLAHQPFGQVPYLQDTASSFEVFESRAMAKYVAIKAKSGLVPSPEDAEAYARFEQACSIEQSNFDPSASKLAFELVFKKWHGGETDEAAVEVLKKTLAGRLEGYERVLAKSTYLAGDKLTLADLFHLPYGTMVAELGVAPGLTDGSLPNVARWWKALVELPSWAKANEPVKAA